MDGVVCCMRALPSGRAEMVPVSEDSPLAECRHFVVCHKLGHELECEGDSIESYYGRLGIVLLGTIMDGDCGIDTACMMLGLSQTACNRNALRQEISDLLLERLEMPWMHQLLVVCAELNVEDLEHFRSCGASSLVGAAIDIDEDNASAAADKASAVAGKAAAAADTSSAVAETQLAPEDAVGAIEALQWSTGVLDKGVLHSLLASLPAWAVKEQVLAYRGRGKKGKPQAAVAATYI